jgi:hypothetical protein
MDAGEVRTAFEKFVDQKLIDLLNIAAADPNKHMTGSTIRSPRK